MTTPPGWGNDPLTTFLDGARQSMFATFHNLKPEYARLAILDQIFLDLFTDLKDPTNPAVAALAIRAHAAWRAAAQMAMAGAVSETYPLVRSALENALYANRFDHVPESFEIWTKRGESEAAKKRCRAEFGGKNLFDPLRDREPAIAKVAGDLYERAIDLGAHPNELAILSTMTMNESEEHLAFSFAYLSGDGLELRLALKTVAQFGVVILDIIRLSLGPEFAARGLIPRVDQARVGL